MAPIVSVLLLFAGFIHSTLANVLPQCSHRAINELIPPTATINYVRYVPRNSSFGDAAALGNATGLPEGCAIGINVLSSNTSSYNFALFLPNIWNSRFLATGNGGYGGFTNWVYMGMFSQYGFATLSTDTGHISGIGDTSWALNAPERVVDWGYRAMHGSVDLGKKVVQAYYGNRINYSYYAACSTGGRQGLKEVQEYPEDFDGVLVAAPAWLLTRLPALAIQLANLNLPSDDPKHIPADMFSTITSEILKQCDGQDGVVDSIIMDPGSCRFRPESLLCTTRSSAADCLTPPQLKTLYRLLEDEIQVDQVSVLPALALGADLSSTAGVTDAPMPMGIGFIQNMVMNNTDWDWATYNLGDIQLAEEVNPGNATSDNYDLSAFRARGGKLIHLHGLADPTIPPGLSVYFRDQVQQTMNFSEAALNQFYRMFLIPGLEHCFGSTAAPWYVGTEHLEGASHGVPGYEDPDHDAILAMMLWVEDGVAPDRIIATKFQNDDAAARVERQRPLCPYPQQARYNGGLVDEPASWDCTY